MNSRFSSRRLTSTAALGIFLLPVGLLAQPLDTAYHNNAEILAELQRYAGDFPDWMTLDSIGHSAEDSLPIWCVKISDNPRQIEPEAALLFIGQVHAEEVVGVELVLEIMKQMLDNRDDNLMRQRLEGLEIYLIPTANPEGLDVVHSGRDVTFRKNKRDNIGDGVVRIFDGEGWDTSGVDINRNFGTHWDRGDTLFRPEDNFRYNAFRGAAPFSEPESRAIRDLALSRPFLYSIVYHSSRSGNSTELFIAPWFWRENGIIKRPPDYLAINALGERVAGMLPGMRDRNSHYRPVQSMQRKGQLQDWFYVETGCIQFMAEVAADIHPDADTMRMVVEDNLPAVWYLMDLALGLEGLDGFGTLTVIVTDAETGSPLDARVDTWHEENDGFYSVHPILKPRIASRENGRVDFLLFEENDHQVRVTKHGYRRFDENPLIVSGERTVLEVALQREETTPVRLYTRDKQTGNMVSSRLSLSYQSHFWEDFIYIPVLDLYLRDGLFDGSLPVGNYDYTITSHGYVPMRSFEWFWRDSTYSINMAPGQDVIIEDFSAPVNYPHEGDGWGITSFDGRSCLTESIVGDYPTSSDLWLTLPDIVHLDTAKATLRIIHLPYCEPQDDYQQIEWWTNPDNIHTKRYSQLRASRQPSEVDGADIPDWDTLYISLDSLERGDLSVRFRTVSDDAIGEDGWLIDEVAVFVEGYENSVPVEPLAPRTLHLAPPYPNPFNSSVTISFTTGIPPSIEGGRGGLSLRIYDLSGRLVADLTPAAAAPSVAVEHKVVWDAKGLGSGVYFIRLDADSQNSILQKVVLIR